MRVFHDMNSGLGIWIWPSVCVNIGCCVIPLLYLPGLDKMA